MRVPADDVLLRVARTVVAISTRAADQLSRLSVVQLRALTVLRGQGDANLGQLAAGMGVTVSTASRLVDRLVAAGLVDRQASPRSRRELALVVTAPGREILERYDDLRLVELRTLLDRLPPDRRTDALATLAEFAGAGAEAGAARVRSAPAPVEEGGDPACWAQRVCPECGRLADEDPPTRCPGCGAGLEPC